MTRETQQLFPVTNGFARVTAPFTELPREAMKIYKSLLIELSRRNLLEKAQNATIVLNSSNKRHVRKGDECLLSATFYEIVKQLSSVEFACRLDVEPPGVSHSRLITMYTVEHSADDQIRASWAAFLVLPSELLEHLSFEVARQRDWIEKNVFPVATNEEAEGAQWAKDLLIRCEPRKH